MNVMGKFPGHMLDLHILTSSLARENSEAERSPIATEFITLKFNV